MIGSIDQLEAWADLVGSGDDQARGAYYCGCKYIAGETNCPHHGDPVERWPGKKRDDDT